MTLPESKESHGFNRGSMSKILKQEVIKSSKNPFGAGRKPKLTVEQVEQVKMLSAEGLSVRKIAAKMDCSAALICKLLKDDHK